MERNIIFMSQKHLNETLLEDNEIIDLYWVRNEKAISETDKKYGRYLYTIAYNIVHNRLDCEECLNDTYLGTWNAIPPTRPNAFQLFLSKIMRNIAVDRFREKSASKRIPSELITSLDEIEEVIEYDDGLSEKDAILAVMDALNAYLRSVDSQKQLLFVCRYYYADSIKDISQMMGISERTVFRTLATIREELKAHLNREGMSI